MQFCIFEKCLDSNQESCRSKQARYQLSHPSPYLATSLLSHQSPYLATHLPKKNTTTTKKYKMGDISKDQHTHQKNIFKKLVFV